MKEVEEIKTLMDKFLQAETSLEEEYRLYTYFSCGDIAEELLPFKPMMEDYAAILYKAEKPESHEVKLRFMWRWLVGAAAVMLLVLSVRWGYQAHVNSQLDNLYRGSYVIVNGERIDNLKQISARIEQTLLTARQVENLLPVTAVFQQAEQSVMEQVDDPEKRALIDRMLND